MLPDAVQPYKYPVAMFDPNIIKVNVANYAPQQLKKTYGPSKLAIPQKNEIIADARIL